MWQISIKDVENIRIGQAENLSAGTGCTVVICDGGAPTGLDIRGGGPAARETGLLSPLASADKIHAIVLSGGSAFGLDAAGGVMRYLEERHIGFVVGVTKVPLVCQSSLFDLTVGDCAVRPDGPYGVCRLRRVGKRKLSRWKLRCGYRGNGRKVSGYELLHEIRYRKPCRPDW